MARVKDSAQRKMVVAKPKQAGSADVSDYKMKHFIKHPVTIICVFLIIALCSLYLQVKDHQFIVFDDYLYVTENSHVLSGLNLKNIKWVFTLSEKNGTYWQPLTWISHMVDIQLWGMNAGKHHLTNLFLHIINTLLLFFVLRGMTGALWKSAFVASVFAFHPINVDTVAWIAERKNLLSTCFWLIAMLAYFYYTKRPVLLRYMVVVFSFILGLLAKPMLVTLPFVLLLVDYWPLGRIDLGQSSTAGVNQNYLAMKTLSTLLKSRIVLEKIPLIVISILSIYVSMVSVRYVGNTATFEQVPMGLRIENAMVSYITYVGKAIIPHSFAIYYPFPKVIPSWESAGAFFLVMLISGLVLLAYRRYPYLIVGWLWYISTLVPVIGLIQSGLWPAIADRWAYVPLIGVYIMIAWGLPELLNKWQFKKIALATLTGIVVPILIVCSWMQVGYWKNSITLFEHTLKVTANNYVAHNNLAVALIDIGDFDSAVKHCIEALRINPNYANPHINLANALFKKGDVDGSIQQSRLAINLNPNNIMAYANFGQLLFIEKKYDESLSQFRKCLTLDPGYGDAYRFIGNIMLSTENYNEAIVNYKEALRINSSQPEVYYHLGIAYFQKNNYPKAILCFQRAIEENPFYSEANNYLNVAKTAQTRIDNLIESIKASIKADTQNPTLHMKLGNIYLQECIYDSAIAQYQEVLSLQPQFIPAMYGLATIYSEKNEVSSAINILQKIKKIQPNNPDVYYDMACIYAKQNMTKESIGWLNQAIDKGFKNWDQIKNDPDLANIRNTSYVLGLMKNCKT